jgi:hypothetical protein
MNIGRRYPELGGMAMTQVLEKERETYEKHQAELLATDEGKYVLIHGDQVHGTFDTEMDAIHAGYDHLGNVPFLVKQIVRVETPVTFGGGVLTLAE